ncbi:MAG TPA: nucleotidyltransferase family protein [Flavobacterium sp.]|jgi:uncharacterized protein|nr:nucleotidyltransferase family protein [Flavobacterium sp.]
MKYKEDFIQLLSQDRYILETLTVVRNLNLNDCWIGAGFLRNKIWDVLHEIKTLQQNDIDVVFFDTEDSTEATEKEMELHLAAINPKVKWSVKNQARMHLRNHHSQYNCTEDALSYWPETATAIAARVNSNDEIEILAPYGLNDLFQLIIRPTPNFNPTVFQKRLKEKQWERQWPKLKLA